MKCAGCGITMDWTKRARDDAALTPKAGDNLVCVECRAVLIVMAGGVSRVMTAAEYLDRRPESQALIRDARIRRKNQPVADKDNDAAMAIVQGSIDET